MRGLNRSLALVLSGGGARGAYEAGVLSYIRSQMPMAVRQRPFDILSGVSVGAINASFLASTSHQPDQQGARLATLWRSLEEGQIYRRDTKALWKFINKSSTDLFKHLLFGVRNSQSHFNGLLDPSPLLPLLAHTIKWGQIQRNIRRGCTKALALVATDIASGRCSLFLNHHPDMKYSGHYSFYTHPVRPHHVLASAAIPFVFPPVEINGTYFTDGGLRLGTPVAPAIQLGAQKILAISLQSKRAFSGKSVCMLPQEKAASVTGQLLGTTMGSLFLDRVDLDIEHIERINQIIEWGRAEYGEDYLDRINAMLTREQIEGDIAERGLQRIDLLKIQPSVNLSQLCFECFEKTATKNATLFERMLIRAMDVDSTSGAEFLSYLMFNKLYLHRLVELGFDDARAQHDELLEFFSRD